MKNFLKHIFIFYNFYFGHIFAVQGKAFHIAMEQDISLYDFVRTIIAQHGFAGHISKVLYTNQSVDAQKNVLHVTKGNHVDYKNAGNELVSVIIPSKDNGEILSRCLETLVDMTEYSQYEMILVDNGRTKEQKMWITAKIEQIKEMYLAKWHQELAVTYL